MPQPCGWALLTPPSNGGEQAGNPLFLKEENGQEKGENRKQAETVYPYHGRGYVVEDRQDHDA